MKKALLKLFQNKSAFSQDRKIDIGEQADRLMQDQLASMGRFGQPLIVAYK